MKTNNPSLKEKGAPKYIRVNNEIINPVTKAQKPNKAKALHPVNYWCGPHALFHVRFQEQ